MGLNKNVDLTRDYKLENVYSVTLDVSGWDKVTFHAIGTITNPVYVYGSNNGGDLTGIRNGNATLATDWTPIQMVRLATGTEVSSFNSEGLYKADVNAQYMKLSGGNANIYQLRAVFQKGS